MDTTLDITMDTTYQPSTLNQLSAKGGKWYVFVTKPTELQSRPKEQVRRSTGTTDEKLAKRKQHQITQNIYAEFDKALNRDPFIELVKTYWDEASIGYSIEDASNSVEAAKAGERVFIIQTLLMRKLLTQSAIDKLFEHLDIAEAKKVRLAIEFLEDDEPNPYPARIQQRQFIEQQSTENKTVRSQNKKLNLILNATGCPTINDFMPSYLAQRKWDTISEKHKRYIPTHIKKCVEIIGDLPVDQILPTHATQIAEVMEDSPKTPPYSNATIRTYVGGLSGLLTYIHDNETNTDVNPPKPWITSNVLKGVKLEHYGEKKRSFEALTEEQLHALFKLPMPNSDRLLLSILITTGMRLDEAALLRWDQYKTDKNGIRYFDLATDAIVKTSYSKRLVALPDCLKMPVASEGRIFDFKIGLDNKSSKFASRRLNDRYFKKIRNDENDDRKVAHSLRHNLTGLLLNLTPTPSSEVMNWITGHGAESNKNESERVRTYQQDVDLRVKYDIINQIKHPWL